MNKGSGSYKCKKKCGHCCMICVDIYLTPEEVEKNIYEIQKRKGRCRLNGWSNKVLKRKQIYNKELKKKIYACFYFDSNKSKCTIYKNRPESCRWYNCKEHKHGKKENLIMDEMWNDILKGNTDNISCFEE